jgi:hypothetical protein
MMDRLLSVLVAICLALLVWLYARSRDQEILDHVPLPVQVNLASSQMDSHTLEINGATQVLVSFTGSPVRIRELRGMLQRNELQLALSYTIPPERLNEGRFTDTVHVEASDVHAPPGVTPRMVEGRNRIPVTVHRLVERRLPVRFESIHGEGAGGVILEPATVLVRGPQEVLERTRFIPTEPSPLPARTSVTSSGVVGRVAVVQELDNWPVRVFPSRVMVRLPPLQRKQYEIADVPVSFLCPPKFELRPQFIDERAGRISVQVQGPVQDDPPRVLAYIDLTKGRFTSGLNHEPLQIQLPRDFVLAQDTPRVIAFELLPADFVPKGLGTIPPR